MPGRDPPPAESSISLMGFGELINRVGPGQGVRVLPRISLVLRPSGPVFKG